MLIKLQEQGIGLVSTETVKAVVEFGILRNEEAGSFVRLLKSRFSVSSRSKAANAAETKKLKLPSIDSNDSLGILCKVNFSVMG